MKLSDKQKEFAHDVGKLLIFIFNCGWAVTFGDAYRDPRCPYGHNNSLHKRRLAIDLNLFIDGEYKIKSEDYKELGIYWKNLNPDNAWGGDFSNPDGNHFSRKHEGMQ